MNKSIEINKIKSNNDMFYYDYFDPPVTLNVSLVGHSFPPGTQIFMPMYELNPKREIFFPPTSINQSLYQTLKIENKNDTPLFYKIIQDPTNVFRVHNKNGLIPSKSFHLICIEFSPKEATVYRFPLRIIFNHDSESSKTLILNGLCTDPVIDIEGVKNEMYFAPTYVGIKTKKIIKIKNLSPITILVKIKIDTMVNGLLEVEENEFEMGTNLIKNVAFYMTPEKNDEVKAHVSITAEKKLDKIKNLEKIKTFEESVSKLNAKNNKLEELVSYSKELQIEKFETENKISAYNNKIKKYTDEINSINEKYKYNQKELENCNADVEYLQKCIEDLRAKEQILNEEEKQNMNNYKEKI